MKRNLIILWGLAAIVTLLWPARGLAVPKDVVFYNDAVVGPDDLYSVVTVYDSPPETTTIEFYGHAHGLLMNDSSTLNIYEGGGFSWDGQQLYTQFKLYDNSIVNVYTGSGFYGGTRAFLCLYDSGMVNVMGGQVDSLLSLANSSTLNLYEGQLSLGFNLQDYSTLNAYGGKIETFLGNITVPSTAIVNIYGYGFEYNPEGRWRCLGDDCWWESKLTGYTFDGKPFTYWGIPDPTTHPNINLIPEPNTLVVFGLGAIAVLRNQRLMN
jgi:hypothetical protein